MPLVRGIVLKAMKETKLIEGGGGVGHTMLTKNMIITETTTQLVDIRTHRPLCGDGGNMTRHTHTNTLKLTPMQQKYTQQLFRMRVTERKGEQRKRRKKLE